MRSILIAMIVMAGSGHDACAEDALERAARKAAAVAKQASSIKSLTPDDVERGLSAPFRSVVTLRYAGKIGTGFLVSADPDLIATCHHVVPDIKRDGPDKIQILTVAENILSRPVAGQGPDGKPIVVSPGLPAPLRSARVVFDNDAFDVTILRVDGLPKSLMPAVLASKLPEPGAKLQYVGYAQARLGWPPTIVDTTFGKPLLLPPAIAGVTWAVPPSPGDKQGFAFSPAVPVLYLKSDAAGTQRKAVMPGDSGGPVYDGNNNVIGMIRMKGWKADDKLAPVLDKEGNFQFVDDAQVAAALEVLQLAAAQARKNAAALPQK